MGETPTRNATSRPTEAGDELLRHSEMYMQNTLVYVGIIYAAVLMHSRGSRYSHLAMLRDIGCHAPKGGGQKCTSLQVTE